MILGNSTSKKKWFWEIQAGFRSITHEWEELYQNQCYHSIRHTFLHLKKKLLKNFQLYRREGVYVVELSKNPHLTPYCSLEKRYESKSCINRFAIHFCIRIKILGSKFFAPPSRRGSNVYVVQGWTLTRISCLKIFFKFFLRSKTTEMWFKRCKIRWRIDWCGF